MLSDVVKYSRSGVYIILNTLTQKVYVGQASNIYSRWSVHKWGLRNNKHHCSYLQRAWNKYGEDQFEFLVVKFCSVDDLNSWEEQFFEKYKGRLYNLKPPGKQARGFKHTEECRARMRASARVASNTEAQKKMRSERAKRQHAQGLISYRAIIRPLRVCRSCNRPFNRYKLVSGGHHNGNHCLVCMASHFASNGGRLHLENFAVSVDEFDDAAYELTWNRPYP